MATDLERLVVQLSADVRGFEREMNKINGVTAKQARAAERNMREMQRRFGSIGKGAANAIIRPLAGIAAALGTRQLIEMTSQWTDLTARVRLAAGGIDEGREAMERLSRIARNTYSDLQTTVDAFALFAPVLNELGVSTNRQMDFLATLNDGLVVSGAKGDQAARVMDALSKAMALGTLQGDNLNTVVAQGGRVAEALAASLGVGVTQLRRLGQEGKIGRREMLAITSQMQTLRTEAESMPATIKDGFLLLNNALIEYIGRGDEATGISARLAEALTVIADNFDTVADTALKVASVIAAALVGRSIAGMISKLGAATTVVKTFGMALLGLGAAGGARGAILSLSAAAGPLGAIFGTLLAGGLILYNSAAGAAEERTKNVRDELTKLGLVAPEVKAGVDDVAGAVDALADEDRIARLKMMRAELDAMRQPGIFDGRTESLDAVLDKIAEIESRAALGLIVDDEETRKETSALLDQMEALRETVEAARRGEISFAEMQARINALDLSGASEEVASLVLDIQSLAGAAKPIELVVDADEAEIALANAKQALADFRASIVELSDVQMAPEIKRQFLEIIDSAGDTEKTVRASQQALAELADAYPDVAGYAARLQPLFSVLGGLFAQAVATRNAMALAASGASLTDNPDTDNAHARAAATAAANSYIAAQRELNARTSEQIRLDEEMEAARLQAIADGIALSEQQIEMLAREKIAADEARAAADKAARGGSKAGGGRKSTSTLDLGEDDIANLEREISLIGKSTAEVAKSRAAWEMLRRAKQAGVPIDQELLDLIDQQATKVGELTAQLEHGQIGWDTLRNGIDDVSDAIAGAIVMGESLRESMARILRQMAADILSSGVREALLSLIPSGSGGLFSKLVGAIAGAGGGGGSGGNVLAGVDVKKFASGTNYAPGGLAWVGEQGPELVNLPRGAQVFNAAISRRMAQGGGDTMNINISIDGANGDQHVISLVQQGVAAGLRAYDRTMPDRVQQINANPRVRSR